MVEVFTVGGGDFIVNVLNAVAAWTGDGGYKSLIQVVMVMGLAMASLIVAFNQDWRAWINWFLQATLIYMCLMVPRVDVHVTDRVNPSLAPADVANVPLGLGLLASFTSQIGDYLVRSAEVVFSLPNDMNYSTNGMVYGSRLLEATQTVQINDPEFATNLDEHMRSCVFYDVMLGRKSMDALAKTPDLWAAIGPGSQARAQKYLTRNPDGTVTSSILTCREAYDDMSAKWDASNGVVASVLGPLAKQLYPKLDDATARAKLAADVPSAYNYMTGVSSSASSILKQNLLINAMQQSMHTMPGSTGASAVDVYAQTRAELQTRNTYSAISRSAMKWVPLLNIVLTTLFYALFPVLFPLFMLPKSGVLALKGYVTGFFYLAAWGPIFVILHMIMNYKAAADMAAAGGGIGMTLASSAGIAGVNDDVGLLAGYLVASVPFLAAGVAKGAMAMSSHATSFLAPSQNAAESAAAEATTGNLSVGNSSFDNQTVNTRQQGIWNTAPNLMAGGAASAFRYADGTVTTQHADATVVDSSGAISRLAVTPQLSSALEGAATKNAESFFSRASSLSNSASTTMSSALTKAAEFRHQVTSGNTLESSYGTDARQVMNNSWSMIDQAGDALARKMGIDQNVGRSLASEWFATGQLSANGGARIGFGRSGGNNEGSGAGGSGINFGAGYSMSGGKTDRSTQSGSLSSSFNMSEAADFLQQVSRNQNWSEQRDSFNRAAASSSSGELNSKAQSVASTFTEASNLSREARQSYETGRRFADQVSLRDSEGVSVSRNLSQGYIEYVLAEQRANPLLDQSYNPTRSQATTPEEIAVENFWIDRYVAQWEKKVRDGVEPDLIRPTPAGIERPSVSTQAGLRKLGAEREGAVLGRELPDSGAPDRETIDAGVEYQGQINQWGEDKVTGRLQRRAASMGPQAKALEMGKTKKTFNNVSPEPSTLGD